MPRYKASATQKLDFVPQHDRSLKKIETDSGTALTEMYGYPAFHIILFLQCQNGKISISFNYCIG